MKKVVITGGAGFIGSHLANELHLRGVEVTVIDNLFSGKPSNLLPDILLVVEDIRNRECLQEIFKGADTVFHLAAIVSVQYSLENPLATEEVNVTGTSLCLSAAHYCGVSNFVFSSSAAVYGNAGDFLIPAIPESAPLSPISPYGRQKAISEKYCESFAHLYNMNTVNLRYFNVYGPHQNDEGAYASVISKFIKNQNDGLPLPITGDGKQTRDFVYVEDVVRANIMAATSKAGLFGASINIGSGEATSVNEVAKIIGGKTVYVPERLEPRNSRADISLAKKLLHWKPRISLRTGIKRTKIAS